MLYTYMIRYRFYPYYYSYLISCQIDLKNLKLIVNLTYAFKVLQIHKTTTKIFTIKDEL